MKDLQLNLFEVFLPGEVELLVRERPELLNPGEFEFGPKESRLSVLTSQTEPKTEFQRQSFQTYDIQPTQLQRLLVEGLAYSFESKMLVERELLSISVFDPKDKVASSPNFIDLVRGVTFRSEHVTSQGKSHFGFFASMKVRQRFNEFADRERLLRLSIGEQARVDIKGRSQRVKLVDVSGPIARVEPDCGDAFDVQAKDVQLNAGHGLISRYAREIGQSDLASKLLVESQVASFRFTQSGSKARTWLKFETNFVSSWLARLSQNGRLPFTLPNSPTECYVGIRPTTIKERPL